MAKIPENVLDILGECRVEGDTLFLPDVQLDRKDYMAVNKVLENMGGKRNRKVRGHVFQTGDPTEMLEAVLLTHEVKDLKKEFQFFPTPRAVAEQMCDMAEIGPASDVLEPSCGDGRLADVIIDRHPGGLFCIELNPDMERFLKKKPYAVHYDDFLTFTKGDVGRINRVVMNPPFTRHQDIDHIIHAFDLLDEYNGSLGQDRDGVVNYYAIYDAYSGELLAEGNTEECRKQLGCATLDSFYALANRARRGINKKYKAVIKKGGEVNYPVLGKDDPALRGGMK